MVDDDLKGQSCYSCHSGGLDLRSYFSVTLSLSASCISVHIKHGIEFGSGMITGYKTVC